MKFFLFRQNRLNRRSSYLTSLPTLFQDLVGLEHHLHPDLPADCLKIGHVAAQPNLRSSMADAKLIQALPYPQFDLGCAFT